MQKFLPYLFCLILVSACGGGEQSNNSDQTGDSTFTDETNSDSDDNDSGVENDDENTDANEDSTEDDTEGEQDNGETNNDETDSGDSENNEETGHFQPAVSATWQWQLTGEINTQYAVDIYDIDLFDTPSALIAEIQSTGKHVICYFSGGSYEDWREDKNLFNDEDIGNALGDWEGEFWLDVRSQNVRSIMEQRLDLAAEKGCDGVEPDNMDGYTNNPGIAFTASDQLDYNRFIADAAHQRGLAVGLKNDLDQVLDLVDYFDFAVNEECFDYNECDLLTPFIEQGKAVFSAEYAEPFVNDTNTRNQMCAESLALQFSTLVLPLYLDDSFRFSCQ